ncbi:Cleft lip and palate transmembrane protein 1-like protein [Hypsibius exemplaris]|uniref:Lipid scramblase CLPTM1L n=1 Tax=Hypsibius exemplaris TaxID=2072580 RepID=A0A1W0WDR2_HYPEX|nr:Cleft lip and palate transmembrane protein 1-like protein [Hypsibius exemplaris]
MPRWLSVGSVLTVLGAAYVFNTVWTFYGIYFPAWCKAPSNPQSPSTCLHPKFLCDQTDLILEGWVSRTEKFPTTDGSSKNAVRIFERDAPCAVPWEENFALDIEAIWRKDATYYVHVLVLPKVRGKEVGSAHQKLTPAHASVVYQKVVMTKFMQEERTAMNLIQAGADDVNSTVISRKEIHHWHTKLRLHVMDTPIIFERMSIPHELYPFLKLKSEKSGSMTYFPLVYIDSLSAKKEEYTPVRDSKLNLTVEYSPMSVGKIRLISMIGASMEQLKAFGLKESDLEDVVAIFTETNFYILTLTIVVTVLHLVFDFMAFKNDINFWRKKDTIVGLSGRTIVWRAFSQIIVFLYLMEEKSSLLISVPAGIACAIEIWKVLKLWKVAGFERNGWRIRVKYNVSSAAEQSCDDLDASFFKYLSYLLLPLCIGGAIYSLFYVPHKSWYSWTIQSAVNGVYAFGFLFMVPQLYLNYKLKSVAHLPWRVFSYKALNTFIDDLFAFIVKMPLAHRLACFRDDIIFVFYLVQLYLYPVDKSRANEFGQSFTDDTTAAAAVTATTSDQSAKKPVSDKMKKQTPTETKKTI